MASQLGWSSAAGSGSGPAPAALFCVNPDDYVWQDRQIRFDASGGELACRKCEYIIDSINSVEDTKGNSGERGSLIVTNLRILWVSHKNSRTNLSIGFKTTQSINIKKAKSQMRGSTQALCIMTKFQSTRFEFIFTSLVKNSPRLFTTVQAVLRAYETTKLYRDLKLRGSIVRDMDLLRLPHEEIHRHIQGVWNLSSEQGNLGTVFVTNVRFVWHANMAQNFNVSIPYMQMKRIRVRPSKFGQALVIETNTQAGGYILGFRLDSLERLEEVYKELTSLCTIYSAKPVLGIDYREEEVQPLLESRRTQHVEDDVEVITGEHESDAFAAYFADAEKATDREVVFNAELGLAVETFPAGTTASSLWKVA